MSAQTQWFYEPELLPGGPKCPDCRSTESPRLVTFDGIDSGTGEQIHEERFRCSCGFVGESEDFDEAGVSADERAPQTKSECGSRPVVESVTTPGWNPGGRRFKSGRVEMSGTGLLQDLGTPASISPRIERGTDAEADGVPF